MDFVRDPWFFWPALLILWFPRQWFGFLRIGKPVVTYRGTRSGLPGANGNLMGGAILDPANWIDFARAAVGGYALWQMGLTLGFLDRAVRGPLTPHVAAGIFAVGLIIQMIRRSDAGNRKFFAPAFYSCGFLFAQYGIDLGLMLHGAGMPSIVRGGLGLIIGSITLMLVLAVRFLFETPYAFYIALAFLHTVVTFAFRGIGDQRMFAMAWLFILPVVVTFMFRAELLFDSEERRRFSRRRRQAPTK
jgi:hypothetical protein